MGADLLLHPVVPRVDLGAHAGGLQRADDGEQVVLVRLGDRNADHLHRGEPGRERARVVLGEHTEEPLDGPEQRPVDHDRPLLGAVGPGVLQLEALGQVEVELDGRHLPRASQGILGLHGDLRTVERGAARIRDQLQAGGLGDLGERGRRLLPHRVGPHGLLRVPGGELEVEVVEAVVLQQPQHELERAGELAAHLLTRAVDVGVVLRHPAHAGEAVDDARLLVPVHRPELEQAQRKLAVGPAARVEDQVVHRAVHRLQVVVLAGLADVAVLVELGVEVHRRKHAVLVPVQVTGHLVQRALGDVRGVDELVALGDVPAARVVLEFLADDPALRMEHRETGPQLVGEAEQVQLRSQSAMVATLRLGQQLQVGVERLLRLPRRAVHPLQPGIVLVAAPVRGRAAGQRERRDVLGGGDVRAAAQIAPLTLASAGIEVVVGGELSPADLHDLGVVGRALVVDQLELVRLVLQLGLRRVQGLVHPPREALTALDDLLHLLLELRQVLRREGLGDVEVVVEAVLDGRTDTQLGLREQLLHRLCQYVRGGMADDAAPVLGVRAHRLDDGVGLRCPGQVAQTPVGVPDHHDGSRPLVREVRVTQRRSGGRPGRHADAGCGTSGLGDAHGDVLLD